MIMIGMCYGDPCSAVQLQIPAPAGVPFTLQVTFVVALSGYVMGNEEGRYGHSAPYIILGFSGVPVFSGMKGGFGVPLGPKREDLLLGFDRQFLCGAALLHKENSLRGSRTGGSAVFHIFRAFWFAFLTKQGDTESFRWSAPRIWSRTSCRWRAHTLCRGC